MKVKSRSMIFKPIIAIIGEKSTNPTRGVIFRAISKIGSVVSIMNRIIGPGAPWVRNHDSSTLAIMRRFKS